MPLVVLPALVPDIPAVYDAYFAAFQGELIVDVLFPGGITPAFRESHAAHTRSWWDSPASRNQYTLKCVDTETGEIVGMALWDVYLQKRGEEEWAKEPEVGWLEGKQRERAENLLRPLWEVTKRVWQGRPYFYCHVIAVHPAHQRRGIGRRLTEWGTEAADKANLPVYVEASQVAFPLYQKLGFETLKNERVVHGPEVAGGEEIEVPLLAKMPSAAKGIGFEEWRESGYPENYGV